MRGKPAGTEQLQKRDINMEKMLKRLFDYQKFSGNSRLEAMIRDTESRYDSVLSDDDLEYVNAAGDTYHPKRDKHSGEGF